MQNLEICKIVNGNSILEHHTIKITKYELNNIKTQISDMMDSCVSIKYSGDARMPI